MCVKATIVRNASCGAFLVIIPVLLIFVLTGCDTDREGVIDPSYTMPFILAFTISPEEINTDTILVNGDVSPDDEIVLPIDINAEIETRGADHITLHITLTGETSSTPIDEKTIPLEPGDTPEPLIINDQISTTLTRADVGTFSVSVYAETDEGLASNKLSKSLYIFRENSPPEIVSVEAPDTIDTAEIGDGTTLTMTATVDDPDGVDDVVRVQTTNTQPNGRRVGPFDLDKVEPGTFRISFEITPDAIKGTHLFEFVAFDRMGDSSEPYVHELEIK